MLRNGRNFVFCMFSEWNLMSIASSLIQVHQLTMTRPFHAYYLMTSRPSTPTIYSLNDFDIEEPPALTHKTFESGHFDRRVIEG